MAKKNISTIPSLWDDDDDDEAAKAPATPTTTTAAVLDDDDDETLPLPPLPKKPIFDDDDDEDEGGAAAPPAKPVPVAPPPPPPPKPRTKAEKVALRYADAWKRDRVKCLECHNTHTLGQRQNRPPTQKELEEKPETISVSVCPRCGKPSYTQET